MLTVSKVAAGSGGLAIRHAEPREPGPGEIMLKVHAAGVCGTDMQIYHSYGAIAKRVKLPTTLGHEACGTVVQTGLGVDRVSVGDLVSLESHIPCGRCKACHTGRAHVCPNTRYPGIDIDGTFAEYVTVPAEIAWVNPKGTDPALAALLEPLGIAVHATLEGSGVSGQTVVVNGCGPIGLMNVAVARHFGAHKIIAFDPNPGRRAIAERMGADIVADPSSVSPPHLVNESTRGDGADVVFEYSGNEQGALNCFAMVGSLGDVRWCATPGQPMTFDFGAWRKGRPTIYNIHGRRIWSTWHAMAPLVYEKKIDLEPVISHRLPLSEGVKAFELIVAGAAIKPLIMCS
ncbi:MAG: alcohol dehydrogenase catalytic domain-containing protein [Alcaligenaceae bacterium]|nr:alcohol dehydrogenase catalytic domain-containing protein [Alcaligenaceae bacterium]